MKNINGRLLKMFLFLICASQIQAQNDKIMNDNSDSTILNLTKDNSSILYLGQTPPGTTPIRFASEIITDNFYPHSKMIISPVGDKIYWTTFLDTLSSNKALYFSDFDGENLHTPEIETAFAQYGILSFTFFNNENNVVFGSLQPYDEMDGELVRAVWTSEKTGEAWSQPQPILSTLDTNWASLGSVSINNVGDIYFTGRMEGESAKIYCSKFVNENYQKFEPLPEIINTGITIDPFIDFQDRYLLFAAANLDDNIGIIDLYISFKDESDNWGQPINLGQEICTQFIDRFPMVTNDGKYLFFVTSHSDHFPSTYTHFYWVNTQIIDSLSSIMSAINKPEFTLKNFNLEQNYPNPFYNKTTIPFDIENKSFVTLKTYDVFGREISTLINGEMQAGEHSVHFEGNGLSFGNYIYQLQVDNYVETKKMLLM